MQRIKTYLSDGSNPNGRLFATDLNSLQDAVAALTDLTQHVSVADLAVGESSLLLSRFGAGQAQLSGVLRVASGVLVGVFTTTQRDAIVLGKRPTGMQVFNTTTNQLEINAGTDTTPSWVPVGTQAPIYVTSLPGSPVDKQEVYLVDNVTTPTWTWHLRYNANSSNTDKWEFVGGSDLSAYVASPTVVAGSGSFTTIATGPSLAIPRAGVYDIEVGAFLQARAPGTITIAPLGAGLAAATGNGVVNNLVNSADNGSVNVFINTALTTSKRVRRIALTAGTLQLAAQYDPGSGGSPSYSYAQTILGVRPTRVS